MISYEVGKPFPHPDQSVPGYETARIMTTSAFFDVLIYVENPAADKALVTNSPLRYGLYQQKNVPFFLIDFGGELSFDMPFNINHVKNDVVEEWLNGKGNTISIYLIDTRTNILHGIRFISVRTELAEMLRDVAEKQDEMYPSMSSVDKIISEITNSLTSDEMMKRATMYRL